MNVTITYNEAQELISKQFNLKLGLSGEGGLDFVLFAEGYVVIS